VLLAPLGGDSASLFARLPNLAGDTPLTVAVRRGRPALVTMLLSVGADVEATDSYGRSAMHLMADGDVLSVANALLAAVRTDILLVCYVNTY